MKNKKFFKIIVVFLLQLCYTYFVDKKQINFFTLCILISKRTKEILIMNIYEEILKCWSEELEFDVDRGLIYYTKEEKEKLFKELLENEYTQEDLKEVDKLLETFVYKKEEYFSSDKPFEFKGGIEWETIDEWYEDVEYQFLEVA